MSTEKDKAKQSDAAVKFTGFLNREPEQKSFKTKEGIETDFYSIRVGKAVGKADDKSYELKFVNLFDGLGEKFKADFDAGLINEKARITIVGSEQKFGEKKDLSSITPYKYTLHEYKMKEFKVDKIEVKEGFKVLTTKDEQKFHLDDKQAEKVKGGIKKGSDLSVKVDENKTIYKDGKEFISNRIIEGEVKQKVKSIKSEIAK